jgi:hypothetical protein
VFGTLDSAPQHTAKQQHHPNYPAALRWPGIFVANWCLTHVLLQALQQIEVDLRAFAQKVPQTNEGRTLGPTQALRRSEPDWLVFFLLLV